MKIWCMPLLWVMMLDMRRLVTTVKRSLMDSANLGVVFGMSGIAFVFWTSWKQCLDQMGNNMRCL